MTGQNVRHGENSMVRMAYAMVKYTCKTKKITVALESRKRTCLEKVKDHTNKNLNQLKRRVQRANLELTLLLLDL